MIKRPWSRFTINEQETKTKEWDLTEAWTAANIAIVRYLKTQRKNDKHLVAVANYQVQGRWISKFQEPADVCVGNESSEEAEHERCPHEVGNGVGSNGIAQVHRASDVCDQVHRYPQRGQPLVQLHPWKISISITQLWWKMLQVQRH